MNFYDIIKSLKISYYSNSIKYFLTIGGVGALFIYLLKSYYLKNRRKYIDKYIVYIDTVRLV